MSGDNTFSVEVVAFASGVEDEALVHSIAETFGIPEADAKGMVGKVPVRVKRGADGATAKQLVGQLLELKADVKIVNEQSGDEKFYRAGAATSIPAPAPTAPVTSIQPGGKSTPPPRGPEIPGAIRANAGASLLDALRSAKDRRDGASMPPKASTASRAPSQPPPATGSTPPAGGGVVVQDCSVCRKKVAAGDICNHCGWSNSQRKRLSPEGKAPRVATSIGRAVPLALLVVALGAGAAGFTFIGPFVGVSAALVVLGLVFVLNGVTTGLRTDKFKVPSAFFKKEEKELVGKSRNKFIAAGVVTMLLGGGAVPLHFSGSTAMRLDSLGIAWETNIGLGATSEGRSVAISTMHGSHPVAILATTASGVEYGLMRATLPFAKQEAFDDAVMLDVLKKCVASGLDSDVTVGEASPVTHEGTEGRLAALTGTMHGKPAFGSIEIFRHEHEFLLVYLVAPTQEQAEAPMAKEYFASLKTIRPGAPRVEQAE